MDVAVRGGGPRAVTWWRQGQTCPDLSCPSCPACPEAASCPDAVPCPACECPSFEVAACVAERSVGGQAVDKLLSAFLGGLVHWLVAKVVNRLHDVGHRVAPRRRGAAHERVLFHPVGGGVWVVVLTPDGDIYPEDLSGAEPEIGLVKAFPLAMRTRKMRSLHPFKEALGPDELADALQKGRRAAREENAELAEPADAVASDGEAVPWGDAAGSPTALDHAELLRLVQAASRMGGRPLAPAGPGEMWLALSGGPGVAIGSEADATGAIGVSFESGP
ncbi:unnamed protein product [Prorocentrum cordatum]|uniref:Uncharacterized protein n=1 Tax=Prorocentrum cordatum TaxID=2364126 RepID=A0ABN9UWQ4_9DINO|nr:unnamed protein product [Polarella glacialis]